MSRQEKVQKWLDLQDSSNPSPPSSSTSSNGSDKRGADCCDPFDFCDKIKSCPVCTVEYAIPSEALDCISNHNMHLCYFCLELINIEDVDDHYASTGHFLDEIGLTVNCPYRSCDPDEVFGHPDEIKDHIINDHLPNSFNFMDDELPSEDTCSESEENDDTNEPEQTDNDCSDVEMKSENESEDSEKRSAVREHIQSFSSKQEQLSGQSVVGTENPVVLNDSIVNIETPGLNDDSDIKFQSPDSSDDEDLVFIKSVKVPEAQIQPNSQTYFVCKICDKIFSCRAALINHGAKGCKRCAKRDLKKFPKEEF